MSDFPNLKWGFDLGLAESHVRTQLTGRGAEHIGVEVRASVVEGQLPIIRIECRETRRWVELPGASFDLMLSQLPGRVTTRLILNFAQTLEGAVYA